MRYLFAALALAGAILSSIMLWIHYASYRPEPILKSQWNSAIVNHSPYSAVYGIPVAVFGIAAYAMLGLLAWFHHRTLTVIASFLGLAYVLYLTNIEAHVLNVWCAFCVASLVVMVVITILALIQFVFSNRMRVE